MERSRRRGRLLGGALAGGLAGIVTGAVIATAAPRSEQGEPDLVVRSIIDAAHLPPLLTLPGEAVTLRYAIVCPSVTDDDAVKARVANYSNGLVTTSNVNVIWQTPSQRCKSGDSVTVQATTDYQFITPLGAFIPGPLHLSAKSTMRSE